jgi:hypothetical protein
VKSLFCVIWVLIVVLHNGIFASPLSGSGPMGGGSAGGTDLLRAAENEVWIYSGMTSAQIQAAITAAGAGTATAPVTIRFGAGYYADLDLSLANDHVILDAGDPGVVLAGTIATSGSPTGVYIYTWDHPSGTYPANLTLTNITEV